MKKRPATASSSSIEGTVIPEPSCSDKKQISISDVKRVLEENEIPFSNEELNELMLEADPTNTGYVSYDAFLKLCKITPSVTVTV